MHAISRATSSIGNTLYAPIQYVSDKIRKLAEVIFGYILRIVVFQLGVINKPLASRIIRLFQKTNSDPREDTPFNPVRLKESKDFLTERCLGQEFYIDSIGGAKVHLITFKSADFYEELTASGITPIEILHEGEPARAIPVTALSKKFRFPEIKNAQRLKDKVFIGEMALIPAKGVSPRHILHSHSPGRSMCMDRKYLGIHLAAGHDVTIWDPRGVAESTGTASEGGYYHDAEAVLKHVNEQQGIPFDRICISGFCKGAGINSHLVEKYHEKGVDFLAINPFTSMKEVIEGYGFLGRLGARYGLNAIQDSNLSIRQDYFDLENKLRNLPRSNGKLIICNTNPDPMMPKDTVKRLVAAYGNAGPVQVVTRQHMDPKTNGHLFPPYEDPKFWRRYFTALL